MRKIMKVSLAVLLTILSVMMFAGCGSDSGSSASNSDKAADAISGTWKQTDEVNGNWTWTFDGGDCKLVGETTGFESEGTYKLDEAAKKVTVTLEGWTESKEYTYTLSGSNLDLEEKYSSYHLVKQ